MSEPFEYAVVRVVPRVERGEFINAGVLVYCQANDFLALRDALDPARLTALDPGVDLTGVEHALDGMRRLASSGDLRMNARERFGWLTAPRSSVLQTGPVHCGVTLDPAATLDRLFTRFVAG